MAEKVGTIYYDLDLDDAKYKSKAKSAGKDADNFGQRLQGASLQLAALGAAATLALTQVVTYLDKAVDAAVKQQNALMGLASVARGTGNDIDKTTQAAKDLASDGLMPLGDSASGLKNLLASGFSLPQAIKLMNAFKDSAAFGRQGSLEFGQAIVGATEGIKNGNSMLVDNAGVTKNLSNILTEAGFSAQDLSKASTDSTIRMALFNGVLKETKNQTGDAAKLSESFGGAMARNTTQVTNMQVALGTALQPVLTRIFEVLSPLIEKITNWIKENPKLAAAIAIAVVAMLALVAVLGIIGAAVAAVMSLGAVGGIALAVGAAIAVLVGVFIAFGDTIAAVFTAVKDWVVGAFEAVVKWFNKVKGIILVILAVAFAPLILAIAAVVLAFKAIVWIVQQIWTVLSTVFNAVWAIISFVFNGIVALWTTILQPVFNAIMFVLKALFTIWWTIFTGIFTVVWTIISTIAQIIFVILKGVFTWVINTFLKPLLNFYISIFRAIWTVISTVFNAVWGVISGVLSAIWGVVKSVFNSVLNFIRSVFNWISNAIIAPIMAVYNKVAKIVGDIKNAIVGGIKKAIEGVTGFVKDAINAGKNLIDGIVKGVMNAKDAVVNKVKEICSGALDAVKNFFGIKSPSRVMAQMGDYLMQGLQNGVQRAGDAVVSAATTVSQRINDGMQNSLSSVADGARSVVGVYAGMYGQLNAMNTASAASLNGTVSAINAAGNSAPEGGAIAQPALNITVAPQGIIARSRGEFRDIIADGLEAVNEDLRARGYNEIGDGKVKGSSTT